SAGITHGRKHVPRTHKPRNARTPRKGNDMSRELTFTIPVIGFQDVFVTYEDDDVPVEDIVRQIVDGTIDGSRHYVYYGDEETEFDVPTADRPAYAISPDDNRAIVLKQ